MSAGAVAALIAAIALLLLVVAVSLPLIKLGRTLDGARIVLRAVADGEISLVVPTPVASPGQEQSAPTRPETARISAGQAQATALEPVGPTATPVSTEVSAAISSSIIKAAAFTYGVRKTMQDRREDVTVRNSRSRHRSGRAAGRGGRR